MKNKIQLIPALVISVLMLTIAAYALPLPTISAGNVAVGTDEEIVVPIKLSNNTGICGATISISYDAPLVLKQIDKGDALSSLTMTKPGDLTANPFNIVFDGVDEDTTNGNIIYLHFEKMKVEGKYNVHISYEEDNIVDGNLRPVKVNTISGQITIKSQSPDIGGGDNPQHDGPVIKIGDTIKQDSNLVDVPVYISGNTGICGATLQFSYDKALTLKKITRGNALTELTMTSPGDISANPFKIVFDGIEEDKTNGTIVTLTFEAPARDGVYAITASYEPGDIVDGNLNAVDLVMQSGTISVGGIRVIIGDQATMLPPLNEKSGNIYIAFYKHSGMMTSLKNYALPIKEIMVGKDMDADYAKVMCVGNDVSPLCKEKMIVLK